MRRMKKSGPNVLYDLNDLLFFLTLLTHMISLCALSLIDLSSLRMEVGELVLSQWYV